MTNLLHTLKEEYRSRAERPDDLFLLTATDAADYVRRGKDLGGRLAGVEGFRKTEMGSYRPQQEFSNDAADARSAPDNFVLDTLRLIEKGGLDGIVFQVVFE